MRIGSREFDTAHGFYIMGILNVTPDSFSDGGRFDSMDAAMRHVEQMLKEGCDLVDIGGESTRPNHVKISSREEIDRVCPFIEAVKARFGVPVSLDTYKADVAEAGLMAGADMINDIWGLKWNEMLAEAYGMEYTGSMAEVAAKYQKPICLMHNRSATDAASKENPFGYTDLVKDMVADLRASVTLAQAAHIATENIIVDPGIGFGKTVSQNLQVMNHLEVFWSLGFPVLLGTSRKSVIGLTLNLPVEEREEGTMATTVIGAMKGCCFFRVHDVEKNRRVLDMVKAVLESEHDMI